MTRIAAGPGRVELSGTGARDNPRVLLGVDAPPQQAPVCYLAVNNDPQGIFEASPPSPSDMLVIFHNLHELGHKSVALTIPLAWDTPDQIAVAAVDAELGRFDHMIVGAPLQNGITPQPLPAAFVRASLPLSAVHGPTGALPIVNGLAVPNVVTGSEKSLGVFSKLESEAKPAADSHGMIPVPLIARWNDRVVLSFPLAVAMARCGVDMDSLVIAPGSHIRLGGHGPVIPVDLHGQAVFPACAGDGISTPADKLIRDNPSDLVPSGLKSGMAPLVVRDERAGHEDESALLGDVITGILRSPYGTGAKTLARLPVPAEIAWLAWCASLCGLAVWWKKRISWRAALVTIGFAFPYACILVSGHWTAPLALATVFLVASACGLVLRRTASAQSAAPPSLPSVAPPLPEKRIVKPQTKSSPAKSPRKSGRPGKKPPRKKKRP